MHFLHLKHPEGYVYATRSNLGQLRLFTRVKQPSVRSGAFLLVSSVTSILNAVIPHYYFSSTISRSHPVNCSYHQLSCHYIIRKRLCSSFPVSAGDV